MKKKLKEFISYIAIIIPIVYIIGFVIINSYLSKYGVYDYEVVSFTYLKSSILYSFLCFTVIAIILISFPNPTDNFKKNAHEHLMFYSNFLLFCSIVTPMLFSLSIAFLMEHSLSFTSIGFYSFLLYLFIRIVVWKPKFSKISHFVFYNLFLSFLLIIYILSLSQQNSAIKYFIFSFLMIGTILSLEYGDYKDGTYRIDKLAFTILMIFFAAVIYGRNVYGELPSYFGGPKNSFKEMCIKDSIQIDNSKTDKILNRKIIYSNSTIYFIEINDSTLLQLNREMVKHITYKIKKP